jgi:hypothetical protein
MTVIRLDRFTADPADADVLVTRRNALVDAVRRATPGLIRASLARLDDDHWIDMWHWDTHEHAQAAVTLARSGRLPETGPAFELTRDTTVEYTELVDER